VGVDTHSFQASAEVQLGPLTNQCKVYQKSVSESQKPATTSQKREANERLHRALALRRANKRRSSGTSHPRLRPSVKAMMQGSFAQIVAPSSWADYTHASALGTALNGSGSKAALVSMCIRIHL
jgi:hypothetical protein